MDKKKIIIIVIVGLLLLLTVVRFKGSSLFKGPSSQTTTKNNDQALVISTVPDPLDGATLLPNQIIKINFSEPIDEQYKKFEIVVEPEIEVDKKISDDKKTITITPKNGWALGQGYSIKVAGNNKFQGNKTLDKDYSFQFTTINYQGV